MSAPPRRPRRHCWRDVGSVGVMRTMADACVWEECADQHTVGRNREDGVIVTLECTWNQSINQSNHPSIKFIKLSSPKFSLLLRQKGVVHFPYITYHSHFFPLFPHSSSNIPLLSHLSPTLIAARCTAGNAGKYADSSQRGSTHCGDDENTSSGQVMDCLMNCLMVYSMIHSMNQSMKKCVQMLRDDE